MRTMQLKYKDKTLYESCFDEKTGTIVRAVEVIPKPKDFWASHYHDGYDDIRRFLEKKYPGYGYSSGVIRSPVAESADIKLTDKCPVGCSGCYMDSLPKSKHAPKELIEKVISGFDEPPYQAALGGGEPTIHPDFIWILNKCRELGTVPNYTTAGINLTDDILAATKELCGGVAISYYPEKGIDWFREKYLLLKAKVGCQINVHLVADKNVVSNLQDLIMLQDDVGIINLVLLAYYPNIGRATIDSIMPHSVYQYKLPVMLKNAMAHKMKIAFSEGLMPYFISRPEIGINTDFAMMAEGLYSCYVDDKGRMSYSSFCEEHEFGISWQAEKKSDKKEYTVWNTDSQFLWDNLKSPYVKRGSECDHCPHEARCGIHNMHHYFICARAKNNKEKK